MAMSGHEHMGMSRGEEKTANNIVAVGSVSSAVAGVAAAVLAILGLVGIYPALLTPIAAIVVGVAFLIEGGAIVSQVANLVLQPATRRETEMIGGNVAIESLAGVAGIVLSILALIGIAPATLLSICAIVYGCGVLLESGAISRLNSLILSSSWPEERSQYFAHEAVNTTAGIDVLVGFAGIVLGILALIGFVPATLILVSMLSFGCVLFLSGAALTSKLMSVFSR